MVSASPQPASSERPDGGLTVVIGAIAPAAVRSTISCEPSEFRASPAPRRGGGGCCRSGSTIPSPLRGRIRVGGISPLCWPACYDASALIRAIISSTAFSVAHFSETMRPIAAPQTFSAWTSVIFQLKTDGNALRSPEVYCLWATDLCGSLVSVQNGVFDSSGITGYQRPSEPWR